MENLKPNFLSNFQKNVLKVDANSLKIIFYTVLIAIFIILIWGYFHGVIKVPRPDPNIEPFPATHYQNARKFYEDRSGIFFIGKQNFQQEILRDLNEDIQPGIDQKIVEKLAGINQFIILETITDTIENADIKIRYEQLKSKWEKEVQALERKLEDASFFDRSTYTGQIDALRRKLEAARQLMVFANKLRIKSRINLPYENQIDNFQFITGSLEGVMFMGNYQYVFRFSDGRPVTTKKFLKKAGVSELAFSESRLDKDDELLKSIKKQDVEKFEYKLERIEEQISAQIAPERKFYRNRFYKKWFMVLVMVLISYLMLRILLWYYTLIRRKGLPKKITHEVYFATNTSSLIFRLIALFIVIIGIIWLPVNLILVIFEQNSHYQFIADLGFLYGIVAPIATVIITIISSWFIVLWSELICFVSNCYHVVFIKAHEDKKEKYD